MIIKDIKKSKIFLTNHEFIYLKILTKSDVTSSYVQWLNNHNVTKFTELKKKKYNTNDVLMYVNEKYKSKSDFLFGIFYYKKHIGNIKLGSVDYYHKTANLSYFIGNQKYWGMGITTLVIGEIVKIAFEILALSKINASVYENNKSSLSVLEKNNFVKEGIKRKDRVFDNKRIDCINYGLLKKSYE